MTRFADLNAGDVLTAEVASVVPFGVFVTIAEDAHGLLRGASGPEPGNAVTVRIVEVDRDRRRASLELA